MPSLALPCIYWFSVCGLSISINNLTDGEPFLYVSLNSRTPSARRSGRRSRKRLLYHLRIQTCRVPCSRSREHVKAEFDRFTPETTSQGSSYRHREVNAH